MSSSKDQNFETERTPVRRIPTLIILLGIAIFAYFCQQNYSLDRKTESQDKNKPADHTGIDRLAVKAINFWEARIEAEYSLESRPVAFCGPGALAYRSV